ncbi:tRNA (cytidine(34)-2'-O)-methyltransferase [Niveibacterium sp. SC-1]|uniref:tRNA (cytidine(34)-2'-O)-methyltransferase n=1 Tax=Niveibacterium sp. SC-1 TaxID=3135646 RepID=UPI00311D390F
MFDIVLVHPEIPPNTGNVIRLSANTGCRLHLVEPLGFDLSERQLKRAGLDYHDLTVLTVHRDWEACCAALAGRRMFGFSTRGTRRFDAPAYQAGDVFVFGSETAGLPVEIRESFPPEQLLRLPMRPDNRSLNLSNTVAVAVFEGWRQLGYAGGS